MKNCYRGQTFRQKVWLKSRILSEFFDARIRKNNAVSPGLPEPGFLGEAGAGFFVRLRLLLLLFC